MLNQIRSIVDLARLFDIGGSSEVQVEILLLFIKIFSLIRLNNDVEIFTISAVSYFGIKYTWEVIFVEHRQWLAVIETVLYATVLQSVQGIDEEQHQLKIFSKCLLPSVSVQLTIKNGARFNTVKKIIVKIIMVFLFII